jgi:hypothetical protein
MDIQYHEESSGGVTTWMKHRFLLYGGLIPCLFVEMEFFPRGIGVNNENNFT